MAKRHLLLYFFLILAAACQDSLSQHERDHFYQALLNGKLANEGFRRSHRYVEGWLSLADPETGLIPRSVNDRSWNAEDAAADNYPFMVLATYLTDRDLFEGRMRDILRTETRLTSRIGALSDSYDFEKKGFSENRLNLKRILSGSSEYIKDGLLPITEWLGPSPWSRRLIDILDDIWKHARLDTPFGKIVSTDNEVNGEQLQVLSRVFWMTGDKKYLEWAIRLGDYYLLGKHHPTRDTERLQLRDHGCEIVSGLCELYATAHFSLPEKKKDYSKPIHEMLDRILEVGRNMDGLFYNAIHPISGEAENNGIADTWGYTYNGIYTVYLIDGIPKYREAIVEALSNIHKYRNYNWENNSSDGYADSIESALNLYNRERVDSASQWIDSEIKVMWKKQRPDGIIEGWHGDGNFVRTTIMYCLWKTQGVYVQPWEEDLFVGAVKKGNKIYLCLSSEKDWEGKIHFDTPRHRTIMRIPIDWPRVNQLPEWFTADAETHYVFRDSSNGKQRTYGGQKLHDGISLSLKGGEMMKILIKQK